MKEDIRNFIAETSLTEPGKIKDDTMLFDEGIFDSMGLLNLVSFLEENFGVQTDDIDLMEDNFKNLNAIASYVKRKKNYSLT